MQVAEQFVIVLAEDGHFIRDRNAANPADIQHLLAVNLFGEVHARPSERVRAHEPARCEATPTRGRWRSPPAARPSGVPASAWL